MLCIPKYIRIHSLTLSHKERENTTVYSCGVKITRDCSEIDRNGSQCQCIPGNYTIIYGLCNFTDTFSFQVNHNSPLMVGCTIGDSVEEVCRLLLQNRASPDGDPRVSG